MQTMHALRKLTARRHVRETAKNQLPVYSIAEPNIGIPKDKTLFQYQPLGHSARQIRLIRFSCKSFSAASKIECDVRHVTLTPKHDRLWHYSTLSYTWESHEPKHDIYVTNRRICIGPNLHRFCQQFRSAQTFEDSEWTGWVWIDQICIDQSDILERNHQVELMADIYGMADHTIVWLQHDEARYGAQASLAVAIENVAKNSWDPQSLRSIMQHPYFSRFWIVQEVILTCSLDLGGRGRTVAMDQVVPELQCIALFSGTSLPD